MQGPQLKSNLFVLLITLVTVLVLTACGQRGDLSLPQESDKPAEPEQQASSN